MMMDFIKRTLLILCCASLFISADAAVKDVAYSRSDMRKITQLVIRILGSNHYRKQRLDSSFSRRLFESSFKALDPEKVYFTQRDVALFTPYRDVLHRHLMRGDFTFGLRLYALYKTRTAEYHKFAEEMIKSKSVKFDSSDSWTIERKDLPRPRDRAELLDVWKKRLTRDLLAMRLAERRMAMQDKKSKSKRSSDAEKAFKWELRTPEEKLLSHLRDLSNVIEKRRTIDILGIYLDTLAGEFGSHSSYMAPAATEDFDINMSLSLSGIGATLSSDDGFIRVVKVIAGGPAGKCGRLFKEDRIISATQDDGSSAVLLDIPVSQAVRHIRGERGSRVLLGVLSATTEQAGVPVESLGGLCRLIAAASGCSDYSSLIPKWRGKIVFRCVDIVRDKVKLDEFGARGTVKEIKDFSGRKRNVGVITLPSFYMDFVAVRRGDPDARRGSADVKRILDDFKNKKVDSVVIDLRSNGGGSLPDAVVLAGLFLKGGTVVQVRSSNGEVESLRDNDPDVVYDGPLVVLTSKYSASASEIFAGAMRDFNRAVLVGDSRTFGKGTVLTVEDLSSYMQVIGKGVPAGSTSFEIAMFFRASGSSVQQLGISTDIRLPSLTEEMKAGELFLDNHLPWSSIESKPLYKFDSQLDDNIVLLKEHSRQRISSDPDYVKYQRQIDVFRRYRNRKTVSLNEEKRFQEYLDEAELEEEAERIANQDDDEKKTHAFRDVVLDEAVNIAADYAGLFNGKK